MIKDVEVLYGDTTMLIRRGLDRGQVTGEYAGCRGCLSRLLGVLALANAGQGLGIDDADEKMNGGICQGVENHQSFFTHQAIFKPLVSD